MFKKIEKVVNGNTYCVYPKETPVLIDGLITFIENVYICPKGEIYYQLSNIERLFKSSVLDKCILTKLT